MDEWMNEWMNEWTIEQLFWKVVNSKFIRRPLRLPCIMDHNGYAVNAHVFTKIAIMQTADGMGTRICSAALIGLIKKDISIPPQFSLRWVRWTALCILSARNFLAIEARTSASRLIQHHTLEATFDRKIMNDRFHLNQQCNSHFECINSNVTPVWLT